MFRLIAVARDGSQHTWDAEFDHDGVAQEWTYRVTTPGCQDFYEARFKEVGANLIQPDVLHRHDPAFRGKGLTEALFARVVTDTGRTLISSTNGPTKNFPNEYRSADAERVWRRLFGEERATYDAAQDRYTFVPQGTGKGPFGRPQPGRRPQFYVKGSYVLDRIFGTNFANDLDIHWLSTGGSPTATSVRAWLDRCALPDHATIHVDRVTDLFACDGGGPPVFNIDLWQIEMDGYIYEMDPATHLATRINGKPNVKLTFLAKPPPPPSVETNTMLDKALRKMQQHPTLSDAGTIARINVLKGRPIPP